jgi:hypothetical protein
MPQPRSKVCKNGNCDHRQDEHKLSKAACRKPWCDCVRFEWSGQWDPYEDPEPTPAAEPVAAEVPVAELEIVEIQPPADPEPEVGEVQAADDGLSARLAVTQRELADLRDDHAKLMGAHALACTSREFNRGRADERTAERDEALARVRELEQDIDFATGEHKLNAKVAELTTQRDAARAEATTAWRQLEELREDLTIAQVELANGRPLERQLAEARTEIDNLRTSRDLAERQLAEARAERDGARDGSLLLASELTASTPAANVLAEYTRWFCQPITGCGRVELEDVPGHPCGPLQQGDRHHHPPPRSSNRMTAVTIRPTFSKDTRPSNGLEEIAENLLSDNHAVHYVVGVVTFAGGSVDEDGAITPAVKFLGLEPLEGAGADDAKRILDNARKTRGLGRMDDSIPAADAGAVQLRRRRQARRRAGLEARPGRRAAGAGGLRRGDHGRARRGQGREGQADHRAVQHRRRRVSAPLKFRKRPVVIEAVQWAGDNFADLDRFTGGRFDALGPEERAGCDDPEATAQVFDVLHSTWVLVRTGDWIIRGVQGEFYPCRTDVFDATYEPVGPDDGGMAPEEHYRRGLKLLTDAERSRSLCDYGNAHATAGVAQAHFTAATTGTGMRAIEAMTQSAQPGRDPGITARDHCA